jgi:hypothetical protein
LALRTNESPGFPTDIFCEGVTTLAVFIIVRGELKLY